MVDNLFDDELEITQPVEELEDDEEPVDYDYDDDSGYLIPEGDRDRERFRQMEREGQIQEIIAILIEYDISLAELEEWLSGKKKIQTKTLEQYLHEMNSRAARYNAVFKAHEARRRQGELSRMKREQERQKQQQQENKSRRGRPPKK